MAGNLEFIKSASGTSVSSLSVTDCFSADYDVYYLSISKLDTTGNSYIYIRFIDSGGSVISASEYATAWLDLNSWTSFGEQKSTSFDKMGIGSSSGSLTTDLGGYSVYIYNPYDSSSYTFINGQSAAYTVAPTNALAGSKSIGVHKSAEQITGINLLLNTGTIDNITANVYGLASN